jgi:hypothetical protein
MTFAHASNAIGGFLVDQFTFHGTRRGTASSPGDDRRAHGAVSSTGRRPFSPQVLGLPQRRDLLGTRSSTTSPSRSSGPARANGLGGLDDFGRINVTGDAADLYRFRTTPLRNVELTAPYGHDGAIVDLRAFVAHYSESDTKLREYDSGQLEAAAARHGAGHKDADARPARHAARRGRAERRAGGQAGGLHAGAHRRRGAATCRAPCRRKVAESGLPVGQP